MVHFSPVFEKKGDAKTKQVVRPRIGKRGFSDFLHFRFRWFTPYTKKNFKTELSGYPIEITATSHVPQSKWFAGEMPTDNCNSMDKFHPKEL